VFLSCHVANLANAKLPDGKLLRSGWTYAEYVRSPPPPVAAQPLSLWLRSKIERDRPSVWAERNAAYCFTQTITAFAPPSQLAPDVPSMRTVAPPAQ
jgi:hypothetical protein